MNYNKTSACSDSRKLQSGRGCSDLQRGSCRLKRLIVIGLFISSCSSTVTPNSDPTSETAGSGAVPSSGRTLTNASNNGEQADNLKRLAKLWDERRRESFSSDHPLGPGDVIEVTVSGVDEFKNLTERVTGEGVLVLPFVGRIQAKGLTDKELRAEIRRRLETNYVRDPQVSLFVKEFRSRQVAVIGAVQKPGLYNLTSSADTILSMISQAGGTTTAAAERILFIPAEPAEPDKAKEVISAMPIRMLSQDPAPLILKNVEPLVISLDGVNKSGQEMYLSMPAHPGDIVMIPGAGEVLVQGWVEKPGAYKITPGLTLYGVIAAAGGMTFPADGAAVNLIRTNSAGHKSRVTVDMDAIKSGAHADLSLREGDVVDVVASNPKLFAWGFYRFFTTVVNVGASANVPIR
jgi:polysaccharide biosynthesis/export protein